MMNKNRNTIYTQFIRGGRKLREILITAIFIFSFYGNAYSSNEISIITDGEISVGFSERVELKVTYAEDISGFQIFLKYDPAVLRIKDYTINPLFDKIVFPQDKEAEINDANISGDITLSAVIFNNQLINGDAQVVSIEFEGITTGSSDIILLEGDILKPKLKRKIVDSNGNSVVHSAVNSAVNVCTDSDSDGVCDYKDNCSTPNPDQSDSDSDGLGDSCDNCPGASNIDQADNDNDGVGNVCDLTDDNDDDSDGVKNYLDLCPNTEAGVAADINGCSLSQKDSDSDGVRDLADLCPNTNPVDTSNSNGCSPSQLNAANAGADQNAATGSLVTLDGSNSSDPEGDIISFHWRFITVPPGSSITDSSLQPNANSVKPTFTPDIAGEYILELIINDGFTNSLPDAVAVIATAINKHTVTTIAGANGIISPSAPQTVDDGLTVSFTVTPDANYRMASVTGCSGSLNGNTYTTGAITADCVVSAVFAIHPDSSERGALIALYNSTGGDGWIDKTGWLGAEGTECAWYGVACTGDTVTSLDLSGNNLSGTLPAAIGNLTNITSLLLSYNQLNGSIPAEIGSLTKLGSLDLYHNQLNGSIPPEVGSLTNLISLYLSYNQLSGSIPEEVSSLAKLEFLYLTNNQLSGPIPEELGNLLNLQELFLYGNQLSGPIPKEIGNLINLLFLHLDSNKLEGEIPATLTALTSLYNGGGLDFRWNALYTNNNILKDFLNTVQVDGVWESTQTIAPTGLTASAVNSSTIRLDWAAIPYTDDTGGYEVYYSLQSGGPYTPFEITADKTVVTNNVTGLVPGTTYYFVVWTMTNPHLNNKNYVNSGPTSEVPVQTQGINFTPDAVNDTASTNEDTAVITPDLLTNDTDSDGDPLSIIGFTQAVNGVVTDNGNNTYTYTPNQNFNGADNFVYFISDGHGGSDTGTVNIIVNAVTDLLSIAISPLSSSIIIGDTPQFTATGTYDDSPTANISNLVFWNSSNTAVADINATGLASGVGDGTTDITASLNGVTSPVSVLTVISVMHTVTTSPVTNGTISPSAPQTVDDGLTISFTVTPDANYRIASVTGCGGSLNGNTYTTGGITADCTVSAVFTKDFNLSDREALIALYNSTNGSGWTNNTGWLGDEGSECTWHGVTCSGNTVISLELCSNQLSGSIPAEIGSLTNLNSLCLYNNQLSSSIPSELGSLSNLQYLNLAKNQLSGSIPIEIGNLANLQWLILSDNQLSGLIPADIGKLTILQYLLLSGNQLSGSIPVETGNLTNLQWLWLGNNQLSGLIPAETGNLTNLKSLLLNGNQLEGEIPTTMTALTSLYPAGLDIRWNGLYTNDITLRDFLNTKQIDGVWETTQTIAPKDLTATAVDNSTIRLDWTAIPYTADTGGYEVYYSHLSGGPYPTRFGVTADKTVVTTDVTGLIPGTPYYFVVRTLTNPHTDNQNTVYSRYSSEITIKQYTVTPSAGANGSISLSTPQTVNHGSTTSFTVTPDANYHIASVTGSCAPGNMFGNTYTTGAITADCTVIVSFAIDTHTVTHTVTPSAEANGTISPSTPQTVTHGSIVSFTVTPDTNYHINYITSINCVGSLNGNTYTTGVITADCTVSVSFVIDTHTVITSAVTNGTISPSAQQTVTHGLTASFTVTSDVNYNIASVTGCGGSLSQEDGKTYTTGAITEDCEVSASFNASPNRPAIQSPLDLATAVSLIPELQSSPFGDSEGDIHISTNWQISDILFNHLDFSEMHLVFDNINLVHKTAIKLDHGILKPETDYYVRVRYSDLYGWSEWSNWTGDEHGIKFTTQIDASDLNGNGIPDAQEAAGPVDLDNNGVDDNTQPDIAAMKSIVSSGMVGVQTSVGEVSFAKTQNSGDLPDKPADYSFPDGVFSFRVEGLPLPQPPVADGQVIEVTFYLSQTFSAGDKWYKYSTSTGWQDYTGRIISGIGTNKITLTYKDGDYGDEDGAANGVIVDPSGPGYKISNGGGSNNPPPLESPTSGAPPAEIIGQSSDGDKGGMCFISNL